MGIILRTIFLFNVLGLLINSKGVHAQSPLESRYAEIQLLQSHGKHTEVLKNIDALIEDYDKATGQSQNYFTCIVTKGISALEAEEYQIAKDVFETVLESPASGDQNQFVAATKLAQLYYGQKDYPKAGTNFLVASEKALLLQKKPTDALQLNYNAALCFFEDGNIGKAKPLFQKTPVDFKGTTSEIPDRLYLQIGAPLYKIYLKEGNYAEAALVAQQNFDSAEKTRNADQLIGSFKRMCLVYTQTTALERNDSILTRAYQKLVSVGNDAIQAEALFNLGLYFKLVGAYHKALTPLQRLEENNQLKKELDKKDQLLASKYLADCLRNLGQFSQAQQLYSRTKKAYLLRGENKTADYGKLLNSLALLYDDMGHYDRAISLYKQDLELIASSSGKNSLAYAQSLGNMAIAKMHMADYFQSEKLLKESLSIRKAILGAGHMKLAESYNNLAYLKAQQASFSEALNYYDHALKLTPQSLEIERASILNNIGGIYDHIGDFDKAESCFRDALGILPETNSSYGPTLNNLALTLQNKGNTHEAIETYETYLKHIANTYGEAHPYYATGTFNIGYIEEKAGRYKQALQHYNTALNIRKSALGKNHPNYTQILHAITRIQTEMGDFKKADKNWEALSRSYISQINEYFPFLSEKERRSYFSELQDELLHFHNYAMLRNEAAPEIVRLAYENQMVTKGILLQKRMKMRDAIAKNDDSFTQQKFSQWLSLRETYAAQATFADLTTLDSIAMRIELLEKELLEGSMEFEKDQTQNQPNWEKLKNSLQPHEALVEVIRLPVYDFKLGGTYLEGKVFYLAYVTTSLTKDAPELVVLDKGEELEKQYKNYYRNAINYRIQDKYSYKKFWTPIKKVLPTSINTLYFIPDHVYHEMNINTFLNTETGKYLIDEQEVHYLVSSRSLPNKKAEAETTSSNGQPSSVLIGNPVFKEHPKGKNIKDLPATEVEIKKVEEILRSQGYDVNKVTKSQASETQIKATSSPAIMHIATHGYFVEDSTDIKQKKLTPSGANPLLTSGLLLSTPPSNEAQETLDDGLLTAYEAMHLDLEQTELVVLSACKTGLSNQVSGQGVYGLQRSFLEAGAKSIVVSLWNVQDEATMYLMNDFYSDWNGTTNRFEAFRKAQLKQREKYPEPYYWGGFIMVEQ